MQETATIVDHGRLNANMDAVVRADEISYAALRDAETPLSKRERGLRWHGRFAQVHLADFGSA
jgi:hypothetical protein